MSQVPQHKTSSVSQASPVGPLPEARQLFLRTLMRARIACLLSTLMAGIGRMCIVALLLAVLFALSDWVFTWDSTVREVLRGAWIALSGLWLMGEIIWARRSARMLPRELDSTTGDTRRRVESALELHAQDTPLSRWLCERSYSEATQALEEARRVGHPMRRRMLWALGYLICAILALGVLQWSAPRALSVLAARMFSPTADTPPYSPYIFTLIPAHPEVPYGSDIPLGVQISGGSQPAELVLLLEVPGLPLQKLPAFREREGTWMRVLEKVTTPCRVAFALPNGRARSHFTEVKVSHSPRIVSGRVTVTPLPYTGKPAVTTNLGGSEILVPDGADVSVELTCNMPIVGGYGDFMPSGGKEPRRIAATADGTTLSLSMPLREAGVLTLQVQDAQGREADMPVKTRLSVTPDVLPEVAITAPEDGSYVVAGAPLDLVVEARDDYNVSRLDLFKALRPFRQHGVSILKRKAEQLKYECRIDTSALGLKSGDELELRAEVSDENPFRFNIISTPTTVLQVISEDEYREILRLETSYEEFMARYQVLADVRAAHLRAIDAALLASPSDREKVLHEVIRTAQEASEITNALAADFRIFDMDGKLSAVAQQLGIVFTQNAQEAAELHESTPQATYSESLTTMRERLEASEQDLAQQQNEAERVALLAQAQEAQASFAALVQSQRDITRRYHLFVEEFGAHPTAGLPRLESLGAEQDDLLRSFEEWLQGLEPLLASLRAHGTLQEMHDMVRTMHDACRSSVIAEQMSLAAAQSSEHKAGAAHGHAGKALAAMESLLEKEASAEAAKQAAQNSAKTLSESAAKTLKQLMAPPKEKNQQGQQQNQQKGQKQGQQPGGSGQGGQGQGSASSAAHSPSKMAAGPPRFRPGKGKSARSQGKGKGKGQGSGQNRSGRGESSASDTQEAQATDVANRAAAREQNARDVDVEQVPPTYREAVKAYFSD